nr:hypothetical protein [Tanacetum cinerariifolium]
VGLAWRLAQTLAGQAGPEVLASYSPERQGVHDALDAEQAKGFEHLLYRNRLEDGLLSAVGRLFPHSGWQLLGSGDGQQL